MVKGLLEAKRERTKRRNNKPAFLNSIFPKISRKETNKMSNFKSGDGDGIRSVMLSVDIYRRHKRKGSSIVLAVVTRE